MKQSSTMCCFVSYLIVSIQSLKNVLTNKNNIYKIGIPKSWQTRFLKKILDDDERTKWAKGILNKKDKGENMNARTVGTVEREREREL